MVGCQPYRDRDRTCHADRAGFVINLFRRDDVDGAAFVNQAVAFSRRKASEFFEQTALIAERGRRECRVSDAPIAACATRKHTRSNYRYTADNRHSLRNGVTAYT